MTRHQYLADRPRYNRLLAVGTVHAEIVDMHLTRVGYNATLAMLGQFWTEQDHTSDELSFVADSRIDRVRFDFGGEVPADLAGSYDGLYLRLLELTPNALGQILLTENVRSVRYRYPNDGADSLPGPIRSGARVALSLPSGRGRTGHARMGREIVQVSRLSVL